ncbi:hypothetical protein [Azohydromonas aeria]|uniref:hypothetical protein n=1 Tax=Azohydromonas aeria TaxID=2590212 RepID=UPI0012FA110C|nr:hypothetical protein [Azohydromonas aeria]
MSTVEHQAAIKWLRRYGKDDPSAGALIERHAGACHDEVQPGDECPSCCQQQCRYRDTCPASASVRGCGRN